jgi:hypothetical protein
MLPSTESRVTVPQTIVLGFHLSQDLHNVPSRLSHERKQYCESLYTEATIDELILLARELPCGYRQYGMPLSVSCQRVEQNSKMLTKKQFTGEVI